MGESFVFVVLRQYLGAGTVRLGENVYQNSLYKAGKSDMRLVKDPEKKIGSDSLIHLEADN